MKLMIHKSWQNSLLTVNTGHFETICMKEILGIIASLCFKLLYSEYGNGKPTKQE